MTELISSAANPLVKRRKYVKVSVPRAASTMAEDISDSGQIVGCFSRAHGPERGFSEQQGKLTILTHRSGGQPSALTCPAAVSSTGAIVGSYEARARPM